jgi:hypothetical protein
MSITHFHAAEGQDWSAGIPPTFTTPTVQAAVALLQRWFPEATLDGWWDDRAGGAWHLTVEGFCQVVVRGDRVWLNGPLVDAGEEDDLPERSREMLEFGSVEELEKSISRLWSI